MHKLLVFVFITALSSVSVTAQEAPKPERPEKAKKAQRVYRLALAGTGGFLGVELKEVSGKNFAELGLSKVRGVAVSRVIKDSAAEKAGLQSGDVVVRFNGDAVTSARKFQRMIREVAPDHTATLSVVRGGSELDLPVTMGQRKGLATFNGEFDFPIAPLPPLSEFPRTPSAPRVPRTPRTPNTLIVPDVPNIEVFPDGDAPKVFEMLSLVSRRTIGVSTTSLTKQLGSYFGVEDGNGVLINNVSKDSPAERAGLRAGDVIVEIDGKAVKRTMDLIRGIGSEKEGDVNLTIVRDRGRQTITVTPEANKKGDLLKAYEIRTKQAN